MHLDDGAEVVIRRHNVVVDEDQQLAAAVLDAKVPRCRGSPVLLHSHHLQRLAKAGVVALKESNNGRRLTRVIDHDDFDVACQTVLPDFSQENRQNAIERRRTVVSGNDYRDLQTANTPPETGGMFPPCMSGNGPRSARASSSPRS